MKRITLTTLTVIAITLLVSCKKSEDNHPVAHEKQDAELTLCGNSFLRGKVLSIVEDGDSTVFIYNSNKHEVGFKTFSNDKQVGVTHTMLTEPKQRPADLHHPAVFTQSQRAAATLLAIS